MLPGRGNVASDEGLSQRVRQPVGRTAGPRRVVAAGHEFSGMARASPPRKPIARTKGVRPYPDGYPALPSRGRPVDLHSPHMLRVGVGPDPLQYPEPVDPRCLCPPGRIWGATFAAGASAASAKVF